MAVTSTTITVETTDGVYEIENVVDVQLMANSQLVIMGECSSPAVIFNDYKRVVVNNGTFLRREVTL